MIDFLYIIHKNNEKLVLYLFSNLKTNYIIFTGLNISSIDNQSSNNMQIVINDKTNEKLLEHYPDDPYSDLTIITSTRKLHLQLAYLSIDSTYFTHLDPSTHQLTLTHLPQQPLLRVLRSLYGQKLIAYGIGQLSDLYKIINQLQIQQYINNIKQEIMSKQNILLSLEFLEFSFVHDILRQEVIDKHIDNQLKLLQSNRNYLQLNKISLTTFQTLLQQYIQVMIKKYNTIDNLLTKPQSQIINHVMQNYFNRNNIKPLNYFKQTVQNKDSRYLEIIWNKYHHTFLFNNPNSISVVNETPMRTFQTSMTNLPTAQPAETKFLSVKNLQQIMPRKKSEEIVHVALSPSQSSKQSQVKQKKQKLQQLQSQIKQRDQLIAELQLQIQSLKKSPSKITTKPSKRLSIDYRSAHNIPKTIDQEQPIKEESKGSLSHVKTTRKSKQYEDDDDEEFNVSGTYEPSINNFRKLPELKEVRTMKKATDINTKFLAN